jgi:hypothetical protein
MSRAHLHVIAFTIAVAVSPAPVGAQASNPLAPQQARVRITAPSLGEGKHVARVISATSDPMVFQLEGRTDSVTFRRGEIASLERSEGTRSRGRRGMAIGLLSGVAIGVVSGLAYQPNCDPAETAGYCETKSGAAAAGSVYLALPGTILGGVIGLLVRSDKWVPVERTHWASRVSLASGRHGIAGFSISY